MSPVDLRAKVILDEEKVQPTHYGPAVNQISLHEEVSFSRFHAVLEPMAFGSAQRVVACSSRKSVTAVKSLHQGRTVGVEEQVGLAVAHRYEE